MSITRSTSDEATALRELLNPERREERLRRMSPENRALYECIRRLREEIGPVDFDVTELIREVRGDA